MHLTSVSVTASLGLKCKAMYLLFNKKSNPFIVYKPYVMYSHDSLHSLSCDRATAYSKASAPQSVIYCYLLQVPVSSLFLKAIYKLLTFPSFLPIPCIFPSITCFKRQLLHKICIIQLTFLHCM